MPPQPATITIALRNFLFIGNSQLFIKRTYIYKLCLLIDSVMKNGEKILLSKKRTPLEFLVAIVQNCGTPIRKTDLYFRIQTSFTVFNRVVTTAQNLGLIEEVSKRYKITQKGAEFLQAWTKLQSFLSVGVSKGGI